jgi:tetratricopeptide (TPR) repeat protein
MADMFDRQLGDRDSALLYLNQAMSLDPNNVNFYIQKGDMYVASGEYDSAFEAYDQAVAMGRSGLEMYTIRTNTRLKMLESKYGTDKTSELKSRMTEMEKDQLCGDLTRALDLGMRDVNKDMLSALICK